METEKITDGIFMVGGPDISSPEDAGVFVVDCGDELCMIDCGAGKSAKWIVENISDAGLNPEKLKTLILTHCHVDHIGAIKFFCDTYKIKVIAHSLDTDAIETGDDKKTASRWYGVKLPKVKVDLRLDGRQGSLDIGDKKINWLHTPGHTPGSIVVYVDIEGKRILFGQDIHGPFHPDFDSDIDKWRESMELIISLDADILCEGHFGIYSGKDKVEKYIRSYLDRYCS